MKSSIALFVIVFLLVFPACKGKKNSGQIASIITGKNIHLTRETISTDGGLIVVNKPGDPLDGLSIDIPAGAYENDQNFEISYADIKEHHCGPYFQPITPLINISAKDGFANGVISINIPIKLKPGHFAMPFLYNSRNGTLEGLSFGRSDDTHIEVMTENLSGPGLSSTTGVAGKADPDIDYCSLVISSIDIEVMQSQHLSPFRVKQDNFQFPNHGSYVSPKGNCFGQAMGMLWYYDQKKLKGSPNLYGLLDNDGNEKTPGVWEDDNLAYKFCSVLQKDWSWPTQNYWVKRWQSDDQHSFWAFTYAIMVTNQPQVCLVLEEKSGKEGHMVIVYGTRNGELLVSDPNFPAEERHISYDNNNKTFAPYPSGQFAGDDPRSYPYVYYLSKTAFRSWDNASTRWDEVENKSIGKGIFPDFTIVALNAQDEYVPLEDGFTVPLGGLLTVSVRSPGHQLYIINPYQANGTKLFVSRFTIQLPAGDKQRIGLGVGDIYGKWAGFKWVTVNVENTVPEVEKGAGNLRMEMEVNGEKAIIENANFKVEEEGLMVWGYGPKLSDGGIYAYPHTITLHISKFHGVGVYDVDGYGEGTNFWNYVNYPLDPGTPGKLEIYYWTNGELRGGFHVNFRHGDGRIKQIKGSFNR